VRFRFVPFSVHRSRRAVAGCRPATIPLRRFLPGQHPPARHAPMRFFDASRLRLFSFALQAPPCGSFVTGFLSAVTFRARRLFSRPGRTWLWSTGAHGIRLPFAALLLSARVNDRVSTRSGPRAVESVLRRREWFSPRLSRQAVATVAEADVRLLGFGPADKPFPAVHRPRYSFCAEGRRDARAVAALGFCSSFRSSESPASGLHLWSLSAGAFRSAW